MPGGGKAGQVKAPGPGLRLTSALAPGSRTLCFCPLTASFYEDGAHEQALPCAGPWSAGKAARCGGRSPRPGQPVSALPGSDGDALWDTAVPGLGFSSPPAHPGTWSPEPGPGDREAVAAIPGMGAGVPRGRGKRGSVDNTQLAPDAHLLPSF